MSEPTKQQGDEAEDFARKFAKNYSWQFVLPPSALFKLITEVRAQATNDALERAARCCHKTMIFYRAFAADDCDEYDEYPHGKADGAEKCRNEIRAMKVPQ